MSWFSRKKKTVEPEVSRYQGRPLLILVENYVLHAIGCLPSEKVELMAAAVQRQWGGGADWCATLRTALDMKDSFDEHLRGMWERNQVIAQQRGETLTPEDFARMIADVNFVPLIRPVD
jgi:hypothetical protein